MITYLLYRPYSTGKKTISEAIADKHHSSFFKEMISWLVVMGVLVLLLPLNFTTAGYCFICYIMATVAILFSISQDLYPSFKQSKVLSTQTYHNVSIEKTKGLRIRFTNHESNFYHSFIIRKLYLNGERIDIYDFPKDEKAYKSVTVEKVLIVPDSELQYTDEFSRQRYIIKVNS